MYHVSPESPNIKDNLLTLVKSWLLHLWLEVSDDSKVVSMTIYKKICPGNIYLECLEGYCNLRTYITCAMVPLIHVDLLVLVFVVSERSYKLAFPLVS